MSPVKLNVYILIHVANESLNLNLNCIISSVIVIQSFAMHGNILIFCLAYIQSASFIPRKDLPAGLIVPT